jgi:hypothetical protein
VGTTNPYPHLFTSGKGFAINQGTFGIDAACDNIVGIFNRTGTDGSILEFKKDGATVGSIGTVSGDIRIGGLDDNHASIRFAASSKAVLPVKNSDGDLSDNTTDLGASNARFKYLYLSGGINNGTNTIAFSGGAFAGDGAGNDANIDLGRNNRRFQNLYLSGGVVFGSTGGSVTSKTLDDYEEGTWTPTYSIDNGSVTSYNVQQGWYVKVGSFVTLWFQIQANFSSGAYYIRLANLPYAVSAPNTQPLRLPVYVEGSEGYLAVAGGSVFYTGSTINAYATGNDYTGRRVSGSYTYRTS